jgi:hypothetical protein
VFVDGQGAVRRHRWYSEAGGDVEADSVRKPDDTFRGHGREFLSCAGGAAVCGEIQPHPVTRCEIGNVGTDGVDNAGTVLVRDDLGKGDALTRAGLPVGGVHAGDGDADSHLARTGSCNFPVDEREHRRGAGT